MERRPVVSGNVKAIGHDGTMLEVEYLDGSVYACPAGLEETANILLAPSIGAHLAQHFKGRLQRVTAAPAKPPAKPPAAAVAQGMDIVQPDDCCSQRLLRALRVGLDAPDWECPKCGTVWVKTVEGEARTWRPDVTLDIVPLRQARQQSGL